MKKVVLALSILSLLPCSSTVALSNETKSKICAIASITASVSAFLPLPLKRGMRGTLIGVAFILAAAARHYSLEKIGEN